MADMAQASAVSERPPTNREILTALERSLQHIYANSGRFGNPQFNENDFFHGHLLQENSSGNRLFLFHTQEYAQNPDPLKRNITFYFGGNEASTVRPTRGGTVYPDNLNSFEFEGTGHTGIYFHQNLDKLRDIVTGRDSARRFNMPEIERPLPDNYEIHMITLTAFNKPSVSLFVAIPREFHAAH